MTFYELITDRTEYAEWVRSRTRDDWDFGDLHDELLVVLGALRDAQEAAEEYWEAWQDAAGYWKEKVESLKGDREFWYDAAKGFREERDRLREALKRYGQHDWVCRWQESGAREACTCGLSDLVA